MILNTIYFTNSLNTYYEFYCDFFENGMHIIFKKQLINCKYLFRKCDNIYKIDCSQIIIKLMQRQSFEFQR